MRKLEDLPYILDYIYGNSIHATIDIGRVRLLVSKRTGKVKQLYYDRRLIGTFRSNGSFAPTPSFYYLASKNPIFEQNTVIIREDAVTHIQEGSSVFVQNVKKMGRNVSVGSDVFILSPNRELIGIGRSTISTGQIERFKSGLCVKNRVIKEWGSN
ncbi:MAG: PUA domain-containing protein [Nitrososphaeria archaeon]